MTTHNLLVTIGASLKSGFGGTMLSSTSSLNRLGSAIKSLEGSYNKNEKFQQLRRDTLKLKGAWSTSEKQVKALAKAIKAAESPSRVLVTEFDRAKSAAEHGKNAYLKKRDALHVLGLEVNKTSANTANLKLEQDRLGASIARLKSHYTSLDGLMQKRQRTLALRSRLRGQMLDAIALGATFAAPIKAAMDFESRMADVRKVVSFTKLDGLQKLGEALKALSREIPLSASQLAEIAASGGQLGIKAEDLKDFTTSVAKMATAFDMSAAEAGEAMAKLANVYQIPIIEITKVGDAINHLSDNTASKAKDIVASLTRIGGTARQFGLTAVQASALSSAFISLGKTKEKAGTAINAILTKLQTATKQGKKFEEGLKQIGISSNELESRIAKNAEGALVKFLEAVEKIDKQKRSGILFDLFGMEYQDDVALLVGSLDEYKKAVSMVAGETSFAGSMQREFLNRTRTTANNLQLLKNSITEIAINLGSVLLPPLNAIFKTLRNVSSEVMMFTSQHPVLTKAIVGLTASLIAFKVASIAIGYALTFINSAILAGIGIFRGFAITVALVKVGLLGVSWVSLVTTTRIIALGGVIGALRGMLSLVGALFPAVIAGFRVLSMAVITSPLGAFISGLGLAATLLICNWKVAQSFFIQIWEPVKLAWSDFFTWVKGFWKKVKIPAFDQLWKKEQSGKEVRGKDDKGHINNERFLEVEKNLSIKKHNSYEIPIQKSPEKTLTNKVHNNNFSINIYPNPSQDPRAIADMVLRLLKEECRGALYDLA